MSTLQETETLQCLTFKLGDEVFAVDVSRVREVLESEMTKITKVPRMPRHMKGVINLRGNVVPVIDINLKFGMHETKKTIDTCIIVMEIAFDQELTVLGALVDSVQEVIDLEPEHIEPAPRIGIGMDTEFIKGMGKKGDDFIIILDMDKVFSAQELEAIKETEQKEDGTPA